MTTYAAETMLTNLNSLGYTDVNYDKNENLLAFTAKSEGFNLVIVVSSFTKFETNFLKITSMPTKSNGDLISIEEFDKPTIIALRMLMQNSTEDSIGSFSLDANAISWSMNYRVPKNWSIDLEELENILGMLYEDFVLNLNKIFFS